MMVLNIYLYKLMITNEPFCLVCLPDPDTSLSFFVGTLQKYTVTEHWQKQQNILPRQKILGSPHKTNCDQMTQKSPKTPNCGSVPITRAPQHCEPRSGRPPQPAINYNYHFRYQVIIGRNARTSRPGKRALAMDNAHLLCPKYAWNARNCEICPELY